MASTNKTPQLGLNQWAAGDSVLREDFNGDNAKLEAFATGHACVTGKFVGDGIFPKIVELGFRPSLILAYTLDINQNGCVYIVTDTGEGARITADYITCTTDKTPQPTDTGFTITCESAGNVQSRAFNYAAFR